MPIELTCAGCSKHYTLKDELAGKKIRCKACSEVMAVPAGRKKSSKNTDDEFPLDDDLFGDDESLDDDDGDYPQRGPKRSLKVKKPAAKKRKRRSEGGGIGTSVKRVLGVIGGGFAFLVSYVLVKALVAGGMASALSSWSVSWAPYNIPVAPGCTIDMPKKPLDKTDRVGNPMIYADVGKFACAAISEPSDPDVEMVFANIDANRVQLQQGMAASLPGATLQGSQKVTVNGIPAVEFTVKIKGITVIKRAFIAGGRVITLDFFSRQPRPAEMERFFNSFKVAGMSPPQTIPPASGLPNAPSGTPANALPMNPVAAAKSPVNPTAVAPPVTVETPADMLVPDTPVDPNAPPEVRRSAWRYVDVPNVLEGQTWNAGVFLKKLGDNWVEQRKRAATTYWNETARTADYVEIMRTDRSMFVRLYADRSEYRPGSSSEFKALFAGHWE